MKTAALRTLLLTYTSSDYNGFRPNPGAPYSFAWNSPPWATAADYAPLLRGRGAGPAPASSLETRQYRTLEEYSRATRQDQHSVLVDYDVFMNVPRLDAQDVATAALRAAGLTHCERRL